MKTPMLSMAKTAAENVELKKQLDELRSQLAAHEKRAEAESVLIDMMNDPSTPVQLKPSDAEDFLAKRAMFERVGDIERCKLAVKMAGDGVFEIGEPESSDPLFESTGSKADDEFVAWLSGFGQ